MGLLLVKLTVKPLLPAAEVNETVHTSLAAPVIEVLLQERLWICAAETNGNTNTIANKLFTSVYFLSQRSLSAPLDVEATSQLDFLSSPRKLIRSSYLDADARDLGVHDRLKTVITIQDWCGSILTIGVWRIRHP